MNRLAMRAPGVRITRFVQDLDLDAIEYSPEPRATKDVKAL